MPDALANQIAAGEVVERPASVVKELVENSLDAGSRSVAVAIEGSGKDRIRVSDDGIGMSAEDAALALSRHATSKLYDVSDLSSISSLGFRGEALPSIASVSRFTLRTREHEAGSGHELQVEGGELVREAPAGMPPGTIVDVERLFYNVPARRKFLRADVTEASHIAATIASLAAAFPDVGFRLDHGKRSVLEA
ncbi:MAG TPA: DNA mismatch repair endonuclease MutL, partial [Vicinamibacteria bacterium]